MTITDRTLVLIWIQADWLSDSVPERGFENLILKTSWLPSKKNPIRAAAIVEKLELINNT